MRPQAKITASCLLYSTLEEMLIPQMPFGNRPPLDLRPGELVTLDEPKRHKHMKIFKVTARNLEGYVFANFLSVLGPKIIDPNGCAVYEADDEGKVSKTDQHLEGGTPVWLMGVGQSEEYCRIEYWQNDEHHTGYVRAHDIGQSS